MVDAGPRLTLYMLGKITETLELDESRDCPNAEEHPRVWPLLMRVQNQAMQDFWEKLRLPSGPALARKAIPPFLRSVDLNVAKWLLVSVLKSLGVSLSLCFFGLGLSPSPV